MQLTRLISAFLSVLFAIFAAILPGRVYLPPLEGQSMSSGRFDFSFDTDGGTFSAAKDGVTLFSDAYCEYVRDGGTVTSKDYSSFDVTALEDAGETEITVKMSGEGLWDLTQIFRFSADHDWFTTRVTLVDPDGAETNYIAPLVITDKKLQNFRYKWTNVLEVPFDNDGFVQFNVKSLDDETVSYEVGALFTPDEGSGLILGSLEHDVWKTAVATSGKLTKLEELRLYCGATNPRYGTEPHGAVSGSAVASPLMFIGVFDSWKEGLNTFARANTEIVPKRASVCDTVPFGWNSWGSVQTALNYDIAVKTSDYVKEKLQPAWQTGDECVYINLDAWWDMLSDAELKAFVDHCHANGQKAGIYTGPFVQWLDEYGMSVYTVPYTDDTVTYQDIRLKKHDGTYYGNEVDGCYPLDVTHPATKLVAQYQIDKFKAAGFDYVKVDFLVHASFEGDFYNKDIKTGMQAYNYAMQYLSEMCGDDMFINLAMSPIFPYQYANGRRLACDTFYAIDHTEYELNAVTYGFWEKELYDYTDPDHIVIWGQDAGASENEARSRITSGVISGTSFLAGDNFVTPFGDADEAFCRFEKLLTNEGIIAVAKTGKIFTPVITNVKNRTANIYKLELEDKTYFAVINFSDKTRMFTVETGFDCFESKELWTGKQQNGLKLLTVMLEGKNAALFEVSG